MSTIERVTYVDSPAALDLAGLVEVPATEAALAADTAPRSLPPLVTPTNGAN